MKKALVIEDERHILGIVRDALEDAGYSVLVARTGQEGLALALGEEVDVVILDVMLPGMNGFELCRKIKRKKITLPVLILTARSAEADKISGLELGADDYITKPFSVKELVARVNVCARRVTIHMKAKESRKEETASIGDVYFNFDRLEAVKKNRKLKLSKKEYDIIRYFLNRRGEVVSRNDLLDVIWGYETSPLTRTVDAFLSRIRKKIEPDPAKPRYFISIREAGYKLDI